MLLLKISKYLKSKKLFSKSLLNCVKSERDSRTFQKDMRMKQLYLDYILHTQSINQELLDEQSSICRYEHTHKYGVTQLVFSNITKTSTSQFDLKEIGEHLGSICDHFCKDVWSTLYQREVTFTHIGIKKSPETPQLGFSHASIFSDSQESAHPNSASHPLPSTINEAAVGPEDSTNNKPDTNMSWANNLDWLIS
jgi:hypothetical protein